ncbi:AI-2E family transporter [Patescibacteria group bacterium]
MPQQQITISYTSIIRVIIVLIALFFLYLIREVVALLFVAVILASVFDPWVDWLQKYKIPRSISILTIYIILIALLSLIIVLMVPPIAEQVGQLARNFPIYYEKIVSGFSNSPEGVQQMTLPETLQTLSASLGQTTKSVFSTLTGIFGGLASFLVVLVITFYLTVEENMIKRTINYLVPRTKRKYIVDLIDRMQLKMGLWLRGQLALMIVVGILTYIGLTILGVKYALLLALIAGLLEVIPFVGPWLSGIPAVIVGFSDSLLKVVLIIGLYFVVQQLENSIIVPKVMQKAVGLNPIIVITAIMIGGKLGGVVGALLAVPVAAAIGVYISDIMPRYARE